jgi:deoxyuridine 5'-triphosphate nucleotidohydrolase
MKIAIKRFDKSLDLPVYKTKGAAAFDFSAREEVRIAPGAVGYVPLNVAIATPAGHFLMMAARSSTHKKGLMLANGVAIFDPDFRGDDDEYQAVFYNFTKRPVVIEKGERVTQGLLVKIVKPSWRETEKMKAKTRGGFGSTGRK